MRLWSKSKAERRPVDLVGHTAYATEEGALIPWPVMRHFLEGIQQTRDDLAVLTQELKTWHNQIPDGQERVESIGRRHDAAARSLEQVAAVHEAAARAEAR